MASYIFRYKNEDINDASLKEIKQDKDKFDRSPIKKQELLNELKNNQKDKTIWITAENTSGKKTQYHISKYVYYFYILHKYTEEENKQYILNTFSNNIHTNKNADQLRQLNIFLLEWNKMYYKQGSLTKLTLLRILEALETFLDNKICHICNGLGYYSLIEPKEITINFKYQWNEGKKQDESNQYESTYKYGGRWSGYLMKIKNLNNKGIYETITKLCKIDSIIKNQLTGINTEISTLTKKLSSEELKKEKNKNVIEIAKLKGQIAKLKGQIALYNIENNVGDIIVNIGDIIQVLESIITTNNTEIKSINAIQKKKQTREQKNLLKSLSNENGKLPLNIIKINEIKTNLKDIKEDYYYIYNIINNFKLTSEVVGENLKVNVTLCGNTDFEKKNKDNLIQLFRGLDEHTTWRTFLQDMNDKSKDNKYNTKNSECVLFEKLQHVIDLKLWECLINQNSVEIIQTCPNCNKKYFIEMRHLYF